jgi:hypothetical protein
MNNERLSPELEHHAEGFRQNRVLADQLCDPLAPAQLVWRPAPERWSVAECLLHLNVTAALYLALVEPAIDRGRAKGLTGSGPYRTGWLSA